MHLADGVGWVADVSGSARNRMWLSAVIICYLRPRALTIEFTPSYGYCAGYDAYPPRYLSAIRKLVLAGCCEVHATSTAHGCTLRYDTLRYDTLRYGYEHLVHCSGNGTLEIVFVMQQEL